MSKIYKIIIFLGILCQTKNQNLAAQTIDTIFLGNSVYMDSVVIRASKIGFDAQDFILRMQQDESFYKAFKNLRFTSYNSDNQLVIKSKRNKITASLSNKIHQNWNGKCRSMKVLSEKTEGDLLDDSNDYNYYTAKLLDRLFFTHGEICDKKELVEETPEMQKDVSNSHVNELKKLIFKPGQAVDVPFVGSKTAIFSPEMRPYYDYSVTSKLYAEKIDCYVFAAFVKPEFLTKKEGKTVIKYLETYFDKLTKQVVARRYQLQYSNFWFDFDVKMDIQLTKIGTKYFPQHISYDGNWNVPFQKREIAKFNISFYDFGL